MSKFYCRRVPPFEIIYEVFHKFRGMTKTSLCSNKNSLKLNLFI